MKRPLSNLSYVFAADVLSRLLGFLATRYLARTLGLDSLGLMGFALAALSYGLIFADLGLPKLGTREVARDRAQAPAYARGVISLRLILAVIAFAGVGAFALLLPRAETAKLLVFVYALSLFPSALLLEWLFQGREEMEHVSVSRLVLYVVYLGLVVTVVRGPSDLLRVPLLWLAANVASVLYLLIAYRFRVGRLTLGLDLKFWGLLLQAALPLGVGAVLSQLYMNFAPLALGMVSTSAATGLYTAAFRLLFFLLVVDRIFYAVVFPIVARRVQAQGPLTAEQAYQQSVRTMQRLAKLVLLITIPIAACTAALARPLMRLIFGPEFGPAGPVLALLVVIVVTTTLNSLYAYGLIAVGREREYARYLAVGALTVVVLTGPLVSLLDARGAALALVVGELAMLGFMFSGFRRVVRVNPLEYLWRPALVSGALAMALAAWPPARFAGWLRPFVGLGLSDMNLERLVLALVAILAIAIYLGIMYLVRGIGPEEIALLHNRDAR
jgi:O-antigen/teichoic acid export membrane protein